MYDDDVNDFFCECYQALSSPLLRGDPGNKTTLMVQLLEAHGTTQSHPQTPSSHVN